MTGPEPRGFEEKVARKARRRLKARREKDRSIWFGLGMFGLVGWTVAVPSLAGLAVGVWLDARWPSGFSWAITGLCAGVIVGCIAAWRWVKRESESE